MDKVPRSSPASSCLCSADPGYLSYGPSHRSLNFKMDRLGTFGGPVPKIPLSQGREPGIDPWLEKIPTCQNYKSRAVKYIYIHTYIYIYMDFPGGSDGKYIYIYIFFF